MDNCSALHYAVLNDNVKVADRLVQMGAVDSRDTEGNTLAHSAAKEGNLWSLCWILSNTSGAIHYKNNLEQTPLLVAVAGDNIHASQWLVRKRADVNARDTNGHGLLLQAAKAGSVSILKWLLREGIGGDVNVRDSVGRTPLMLACLASKLSAAKCLLEHKADMRAMSICNLTPLHWASWVGSRQLVKFLLEEKADLNALSLAGETCLHLAAKCGHLKASYRCCKLLVERGISPESKDLHMKSAAYVAALYGNYPVCKWMITKGYASPSEKDSKGMPMLFAAAETKYVKVVKYLVEQKASLVLDYAATSEYSRNKLTGALAAAEAAAAEAEAAAAAALGPGAPGVAAPEGVSTSIAQASQQGTTTEVQTRQIIDISSQNNQNQPTPGDIGQGGRDIALNQQHQMHSSDGMNLNVGPSTSSSAPSVGEGYFVGSDAALLHATWHRRVEVVRYLVEVTDSPRIEKEAYLLNNDKEVRKAIDDWMQIRTYKVLYGLKLSLHPHLLRLTADYLSYSTPENTPPHN
eukprot:CAMPEP_0197518680 /NCGR_PEP_ID=MMETSP1318-20131121/3911_1 /TAXON_ID=552666 /ORGANISM="Partenskyella glossopodia, Strain RCC365" /LENGTH=520 /DNA_ID=CAMNT_0043069211 /DNA_START=150 /DNA_END=1712 /DNA_ORIENTATION=-